VQEASNAARLHSVGYTEKVPAVSRASVERIVRCPFSVAYDYAVEFFRQAESDIVVRVPLRDFLYGLRGGVARPVRLVFARHPDDTEPGRVHDAILVEWSAGTRLLPDFHGTLRMRIETVDTTRVILEGAWRPPLGLLGRIFEVVAGRRIAIATMRDLLDRLAEAMERREQTFRHEGRSGGGPSGSAA
jgi:hypothetical protein